LAKAIAVSLENEQVKIVHASFKGNRISVNHVNTIHEDQLDLYLQKEKTHNFIVTCDFNESQDGVITTPLVKSSHLRKIVESEIRKQTGEKDFSFILTPIGVKVVENKKVMEVFYFAVTNNEIRKILDRFYHNGKSVRALYPDVFSVASLFDTTNSAVVGVLGTKTTKTAFLLKQGAVYFIRKFTSLTPELSDIDIQDINMTVNYCFQNLRINPSSVVLTGRLAEYKGIKAAPSVPLKNLKKPDFIDASEEDFINYIIPLSAFYTDKSHNILSREFRNLNSLKSYLTNASRIFMALIIIFTGLLSFEMKNIADIKNSLKLAERHYVTLKNLIQEYSEKEDSLRQYMPVINFMQDNSPDTQKFLLALTGLDTQYINISSIEALVEGDSLNVTLSGTVNAETYSDIHRGFQGMMNSISKIQKTTIYEKSLDIGRKFFTIKLRYKN
jgi:hypothetical protein